MEIHTTSHEEMGGLSIEEAQLSRMLVQERIASAKLKAKIDTVRKSRARKAHEKNWRAKEALIEALEHRRTQVREKLYPFYKGSYSEMRGRRDHEAFFNVRFSKVIADEYARLIEQAKKRGEKEPAEKIDVCDLSLGQGHFLHELKKEFPNIVTHGVSKRPPKMMKLHPDFLHTGDALDPKSRFQKSRDKYNLIVSRKGPPLGTDFKYHMALVLCKLKPLGHAFIEINKTRHLRKGQLVEEYDWAATKKLALRINESFNSTKGPQYAADVYEATEIGKRGEKLVVPTLRILRFN